jgi:hypothetical protein
MGDPVLEAAVGAVDRDHVAAVQEAVEDGGGQDLATERLYPFAEGLLPAVLRIRVETSSLKTIPSRSA